VARVSSISRTSTSVCTPYFLITSTSFNSSKEIRAAKRTEEKLIF